MNTSTNPTTTESTLLNSAPSPSPEETKSDLGTLRSSSGRFLPGHSGNPNGRPRSNHSSLRQRLKENAESVAEVIIRKALDGDIPAARLVIGRVLPPLREVSAPVAVELPEEASGPYPIAEAILRATLAGTIPPETATQLMGLASQVYRIADIEETKARFEAFKLANAKNLVAPSATSRP